MSISTLMAEASRAEPTKNKMPEITKVPLRPVLFMTRPAAKDATRPAMYNEEVNAVRTWLLNVQYTSCCVVWLSAIFFSTDGKNFSRNGSIDVTPPAFMKSERERESEEMEMQY